MSIDFEVRYLIVPEIAVQPANHNTDNAILHIAAMIWCLPTSLMFSNATTSNFFNRLRIVAGQGDTLCVKPSVFARKGCVRA